MKTVIILHGYGETPNSFWYPYLKKELTRNGYSVSIPQLPNTNNPELAEQLSFVLSNEAVTRDTIFIGHSSGCPLILAILQEISFCIKQVIMLAGYARPLRVGKKDTKNIKDHFDWKTIQSNCNDFVFINSDNDPWGADDKEGRFLFDHLGGTHIIKHDGHFGSDTYKQPYREFPILLQLIK